MSTLLAHPKGTNVYFVHDYWNNCHYGPFLIYQDACVRLFDLRQAMPTIEYSWTGIEAGTLPYKDRLNNLVKVVDL